MKLFFLSTLTSLFAFSCIHAADSAYANSTLYLTSTQSQEFASANSNTNVGYANATAQPGELTNAFLTIASSVASAITFQNESVTGFTDELTINGPGMTGSAGTLDFNFLVSGSGAFSSTAPASSSLTAIADFASTSATDILTYTQNSDGSSSGADFLNVPETVAVPFTFGKPFSISLTLDFRGLVNAATSGGASVSGSFTTTAGTSDVTALALEKPLSNYTADSASGVNYFNSDVQPQFIPEPGEIALLGAAGVFIIPFLRRKRKA
jgi:hypothetical protein